MSGFITGNMSKNGKDHKAPITIENKGNLYLLIIISSSLISSQNKAFLGWH